MEKYNQLSHVHFQNKIWRNELEMIQQETDFFLKIVNEIPEKKEITLNFDKNGFINQFHHFQRLIQRLLVELNALESEIADGVLRDNILDNTQHLDQQYLKEEMDYFEQDYRNIKTKFKEYVASAGEPILV